VEEGDSEEQLVEDALDQLDGDEAVRMKELLQIRARKLKDHVKVVHDVRRWLYP
jgi:hypothetical protein